MRLHGIGVCLLTVGLSMLGRADTIYTYTGPTFTFVDSSSGLTTSNFISVSMTFANPLAPSTGIIGSVASDTPSSLVAVTPTQFTMTDGVHTLDNTNAQVSIFDVATDGFGNIAAWSIFTSQPDTRSGIAGDFDLGTDNLIRGPAPVDLLIVDHSCFEPGGTHQCGDTASTVFNGSSGTWTITTTSSSVPEPSELILFPLSLIAVSLARARLRKLRCGTLRADVKLELFPARMHD